MKWKQMGTTKFKFWQRKWKGKVKGGTKSNREQEKVKEELNPTKREKTKKLEMSNLIYVRKSKVETSRNRKREKKSSGIK